MAAMTADMRAGVGLSDESGRDNVVAGEAGGG